MSDEAAKRVEMAQTKVTERMYIDANRLAAMDDRSLSDWLYMLIRRELYGRTVKLEQPAVDLQGTTK